MNHALLAHESDSDVSKSKSSSLRVNKPGDAFEREADLVADAVSNGDYVTKSFPSWSFGAARVQRQVTGGGDFPNWQSGQQSIPNPNVGGEAVGAALERLLETKEVQSLVQRLKSDPLAKPELQAAVGGPTTLTVIAALARAHQSLPLQVPALGGDFKVKVTAIGPLDRPTSLMVTLSYEKKSEHKEPTPQQRRKETLELRQNLQVESFNERRHLGPVPEPETPEQKKVDQQIQSRAIREVGAGPERSAATTRVPEWMMTKQPEVITPPKLFPRKPAAEWVPKLTLKQPATETEKKKEELPVQRKALADVQPETSGAEVEAVPRSGGRPLDPETRRFMESRIGFDFSKVRIHNDAPAAASAKSMRARAYTVGNDVVFGAGQYSPKSAQGRRLLAHELTHVVQQSQPAPRPHPVVHAAPRGIQRFLEGAKDWLLSKLKNLKGYPLFCVVVGQDLITGQPVEQNATNLIQGVLGLFDGGAELFEKLKKAANAIDTAYHWVLDQLKDLNLTWDYFSKLLDRAVDAVELLHPIDSWDRVVNLFKEPLDKLIELASRVGKKVLDFILQAVLENFPLGKKVYEMLKKAGDVITRIAADPISFAKNLFAALQQGFKNFGENILQHLGDGLKKWIFEEIGLPDLKIPKEFTFGSIVQMVLSALKLTYEQRRPQLVEKLGEEVVYFFETAANVLTRIKKEGFVAVWDMIKEKASNIFDSVLDKIRDWTIKEIVKVGLAKVAALATPIGDAIEIIADIYETIKFFIEKATKFVELIDSIVNSLADMVDGKIDAAAKKVEDTLANAIPLILRFLAGLFHLDGIGESIRNIIESVRKPIDEAIGKVLDFIVDKAKPLWEKGQEAFKSKLAAVKEWWRKPKKFHYGEEEHELSVEGEGDHPEVFVQSNKTPLEHFLTDLKVTGKPKQEILKVARQLGWRQGQGPSEDEKGSKLYDKLMDLLDHLKARKDPPAKIIDNKPVHQPGGGGDEAEAFLSANRPVGSEPHGDDPPVWEDLGAKLRKASSYVRGHFISMRLGGQGVWTNMIPLTNAVNQRMNSRVESSLKKATIPGSNRYFHYVVKATYKDVDLPPLDEKASAAEQKARASMAEQRLESISWTVKAAQPVGETGWKDAEKPDELLDENGNKMKDTVAQGSLKPSDT